jgi:hypothetical protein
MPNAILTANLTGDVVSSITIVSGGTGYVAPPSILINPPDGAGTQATATCTISGGIINSVTIPPLGGGSGYTVAPPVFVIDDVGDSFNLENLTTQVATLQTDVDALDVIVGQQGGNITALDSSVTALQGFSNTGVEGSVVFEGAVNDLLADQNRFIYNRTTHVLTLEQPIVCDNPATTNNQLTRKGEIDTALALKADLSRTLYANTYYLNAGVNTLSSLLTTIGNSADQTILVSSSTHTVGDTSITVSNFTMCAVDGAVVQPASFNGAITLNGASQTRVRVANIQFNSLFTVSGTAGRHNFRCCAFAGGFTIAGATTNWVNFTNCSFTGTFTVPNTFAGTITFNECDFSGTTLTLNNASPVQVLFSLCSNLPSFTPNGILVGFNSTSSASRSDTTQLFQNGVQVITTYDSAPTSASNNLVRSGGIFTALQNYATTSALALKSNTDNPTFTTRITSPALTLSSLASATTSNVLYYNTGTGVVTQGTLSAGTPAGTNTQVQFNSAGAFGASSNLTFNNVTNILSTNGIVCNNLTANSLANTTTANVVYYNTTSGVLTYGTAGSATPAGSNTQVQYNNAGAFAGDAGFTFNAGTDTLTVNVNTIGKDLRCNPASGATDFANFQAPQGISWQGDGGSYLVKVISLNTGTAGISFANTATATERAGINYAHSTNTLSVRSAGAERMTISGTVTTINTGLTLSGIGTATASNCLYINGGVVTQGTAPTGGGSYTTATVTSAQPAGGGNFRTGPGQVWNGVGAQQFFLASSTGTQLGSGFQTNQNDVFYVPPTIRVYSNSNTFTWWQFS